MTDAGRARLATTVALVGVAVMALGSIVAAIG